MTKLSFVKAYAEQCGGSADDAVKMRTTQQLDDDLLAGQVCLHRNGLPLLPWRSQGAPVDLKLVNSLRDELA